MPDPRKSGLSDDDHAIVDCIYSSTLEADAFVRLVENWDSRLKRAGYSVDALCLFGKSTFEGHLIRAGDLADRLRPESRSARAEAAVGSIHTAAIIASESGEIVAANGAATAVFDIRVGSNIADLLLDPVGLQQFRESITRVVSARDDRQDLLRISSRSAQQQTFVLLSPFEDEYGNRHALIVTTEQAWSEKVTGILQRSFGLTSAEVGILRALLSGKTVAQIAIAGGRADATVRSQIHSLLGKTGTRSQAELLRMTNALLQAAMIGPVAETTTARAEGGWNSYESLRLPDGRRLDFLRLGDPQGVGFLWLPGNLSQCRLPAPAERALRSLGLMMIVPVKAGYGYSSPLPHKAEPITTAASDISHLRRQLELGPAPLVAHGNDFLLATEMVRRNPECTTAIIGISVAFPITSPLHYAKLSKLARFTLVNARYAPNVMPFLTRGAMGIVRAIGFEAYVDFVMRGTPDAVAFLDRNARAAIVAGSEIVFGLKVRAYDAFAAETIAVFRDWQPSFENLSVPVTLFHGKQDPNCSFSLAEEFCRKHPSWRLIAFPDAGHFVCHLHWRPLVRLIADNFPANFPENRRASIQGTGGSS